MQNLPKTYFPIPLETVEMLRTILSEYFEVGDTSIDMPTEGYVRFRGRFVVDLAASFNQLKERFEQEGFTPIVRDEEGRTAVIAIPEVTVDTPANWPLALTLFVATILSTMFIGASSVQESADAPLQLWRGWPFSLSIMLILTAHELGHYFAARYHKVPVSPPYFIPLPFSLIGTMGAFIRLKGRAQNKRVLMDIGAAGPLAGMIFAFPILIYGLMTSDVGPLPTQPYLLEGNSILYFLTKFTIFQEILPGNGIDVSLNQVAWAGWVGLLVTALNLLPLGQLDGGHMAYVIFGQRAKTFFWPVISALAVLSIFTAQTTWIIWIALLFLVGRVHAEPLDDVTELDPRRRAIAIFTLVLFFLIFPPIPLQIIIP